MNIAPATLATFCKQRNLTMLGQISNDGAVILISDQCSTGMRK